ncbi:MAG: citrate (Si)-synthase, partial [Cyphobasidiales sp. Tagirdzhanova-0007]
MLGLSTRSLARISHAFSVRSNTVRYASSKGVIETLSEIIPERQEFAKKLRAEHGDKSLGDIKLENVFGGMRGLKIMLWEPSVLDANEGIRFWGRTIPECQEVLPKAPGGKQMLPESMLFYLLTGKVPSQAQADDLVKDLAERSVISPALEKVIDSFPKTLHPMTQFVMATAALNHDSKFAKAYSQGMKKSEYWKSTAEDVLDLSAKVYPIAARIYNNTYRDGAKNAPAVDKSKDLAWNFVNQIGMGDKSGLVELIRLYNALHTDHEGGNVSAHTTHLVNSALSDPFLSYSAGLAGLAGPLHGLANQEVLRFLLDMQKQVGDNITPESITEYTWSVLKSGRVVPGYGHAVLRKPDPRFAALREFANADKEIAADPIVKLVNALFEVAPGILTEHGKTKNPFPNVDAVSGMLLYHYGLTQFEYYTVIFGTSRAMAAAQLVWDRAYGLPIERPKSMSLEVVAKDHIAETGMARDYYAILGVDKGVTDAALKSAYKKLALKHHPDRNVGPKQEEASKKFKEVSEAYEVLADKDKRQIYDTYGEAGLKGGPPPSGPSNAGGNSNPFAGFSSGP